jgi:acyl-CoA thioesterase-1
MIAPTDTVVFYGDSITDCGRDRSHPASLGQGYAFLVAARLQARLTSPALRTFNLGISGHRISDLEARYAADVAPLAPTVLSILVGINDTWHQFKHGKPSPLPEFRAAYRRLLEAAHATAKPRLLLLEPFLLPVPADRREWRADLDARIAAIRELAPEFSATYVPLDGLFAAAACRAPADFWLPDGVHPSPAGHALIAEAWLRAMET